MYTVQIATKILEWCIASGSALHGANIRGAIAWMQWIDHPPNSPRRLGQLIQYTVLIK